MIRPREALDIVMRHVRPLPATSRRLTDALGCCLAADVRADRDSPPADRSAMDGYAVRSRDLAGGAARLPLTGEVAAGSTARPRVRPGACVRILTGANVPPGADAVVPVELTSAADAAVAFRGPVAPGANIRRRGEEAAKGAPVLPKGTVLAPVHMGICASAGAARVKVHARPTVAILCTGREVTSPAARVGPHQLRDSNGPTLQAFVSAAGCDGLAPRIVADDLAKLAAAIKLTCRRAHVVLITGGVSVGKYDLVPQAVRQIGATVRLHGVAQKPGKPLLYATRAGGRHIFGLPGNPVSVAATFCVYVAPALRRLAGLPAQQCSPIMRLPLARPIRKDADRVRFALVRVAQGPRGPLLKPVASHGSADLIAAGQADGLATIPAGRGELPAGWIVDFRPWMAVPGR